MKRVVIIFNPHSLHTSLNPYITQSKCTLWPIPIVSAGLISFQYVSLLCVKMEDVSFNFDFILAPETALTVNNTKESLYFEQQGKLHESLGIILKHWTTKKKIVSRYYNMLPFVLFWSISVSQNPDHEPISNPAFSTTDHGPEFVHTICSNTGKMQTSRKIKLVGEKNCSPGLEGDPCLANNIYIYTLKSHILFTRLTLK